MDKKYLPHLLYFITFIAVSIPVACGYICEGGIVIQWIARVDEIASGLSHGQFLLFPSEETALNTAGAVNALHSNLWLFLPGLVYLLTDSIVFSYQFYVLLIQLGTLLFSIMMFRRLFDDKISVFFGVLLYMTCPYRIYICYDEANLMQAVFWALLPLYVWAVSWRCKGYQDLSKYHMDGVSVSAYGLCRRHNAFGGNRLYHYCNYLFQKTKPAAFYCCWHYRFFTGCHKVDTIPDVRRILELTNFPAKHYA